ncbi:MAG: hypothetical protein AMXMBFR76_24240 [Pseudomonadota bacterium]|jgi:Smg protein
MKESMLDVLIYLFDHYMDEEADLDADRDDLTEELEAAGFRDGEIHKAFEWLDALAAHRDSDACALVGQELSVRIFSEPEMERLDTEMRGLLLYLGQNGILTPLHREIVIERIMALDEDDIDLEQVKWVVLMVLFNMPGQEGPYAWMEDFMFEEQVGLFH